MLSMSPSNDNNGYYRISNIANVPGPHSDVGGDWQVRTFGRSSTAETGA